MMNHAPLSGSVMDEFGFDRCQENTTLKNAQCFQCKVWWRREDRAGAVFQRLGSLVTPKDLLIAGFKDILAKWKTPTFFGEDPLLFQHDCVPVHRVSFVKTLDELNEGYFDLPPQML